MNYKEAWEIVKKTLQISLLFNGSGNVGLSVNSSGLVNFDDNGANRLARTVFELMEKCEKEIQEEEA